VVLALVGIHGVLSYTVARRAPEVGIRMALGADRGRVIRSVVREGLGLALLGVVVGVPAAWLGARLLETLVFGVATTDATTFLAVPALVLLTAAAASAVPAWRAARADPIASLRAE
jgi:putative ABC transport system permease protein